MDTPVCGILHRCGRKPKKNDSIGKLQERFPKREAVFKKLEPGPVFFELAIQRCFADAEQLRRE